MASLEWIVKSTVPFLGKYVHRHFTVPGGTALEAIKVIERCDGGAISVAGYILNGMSHYYTPKAEIRPPQAR